MDRPADTTEVAWKVQRDIFRRLTGRQRVAMAVDMSESARALAEAGVRYRHPEWTDQQVHEALLARMLGAELADQVRRSRLVRA